MAEVCSEVVQGFDSEGNYHDVIYADLLNNNPPERIAINPLCRILIDTPEFQRLKDIKQLDQLNLMFEKAKHTRYEHCIGTSILCGWFFDELVTHSKRVINMNDEEIEKYRMCVVVAGLLHDIGHCVLGHSYPQYVKMFRNSKITEHETMGIEIFRRLLQHEEIKIAFHGQGLDATYQDCICMMIAGKEKYLTDDLKEKWNGIPPNKKWLFQIVSNERTGIDMDRIDYLLRDSHYTELSTSVNYKRIIENAYVHQDADNSFICFDREVVYDLMSVYQSRMMFYLHACNHRNNQITEIMLLEALKIAEDNGFHITTEKTDETVTNDYEILKKALGILKELGGDKDWKNVEAFADDPKMKKQLQKNVFFLSKAWEDVDVYLTATDRIIEDLMNTTEMTLATARNLITRIRNKDFYTCVGEINLNGFYIRKTIEGKKERTCTVIEIAADGTKEETKKKYLRYDKEAVQEKVKNKIMKVIEGKKLRIDDLIIDCCIVSHGQGDCNPFESIYFYDGENKVRRFEGYMMSNVFSSVYEDVYVRFYSRTKENDEKWRKVVDSWRRTEHPYKLKYTDMEDEE
ncbi:hypothetical protein WA577_000458 [Blastocystis sp. JDR]